MTDHTPELLEPLPDHKVKVVLNRIDWERARACVKACAGIPTEQLRGGLLEAALSALNGIKPYALDQLEDIYADIQEGGKPGPDLDKWNAVISTLLLFDPSAPFQRTEP